MLEILARRPVGHRIWTFTREIRKTTARFGITLIPCEIRPLWVSIDRARDLWSQEAAQRRGRWKLLKTMVLFEKSVRLTKTFHQTPERLQSYLTRAEAVFVEAMLGSLWEQVVLPPLRGGLLS